MLNPIRKGRDHMGLKVTNNNVSIAEKLIAQRYKKNSDD